MTSPGKRPNGRAGIWAAAVSIVLISVTLLIGVTRLYVPEPRLPYQDRGDPYSEQIVRNTVINNVIGKENIGGSLIWTRGYAGAGGVGADHRYDYAAEGTKRYYSNRGLQQWVYTRVGLVSRGSFANGHDDYFTIFRLLNCILLTASLAGFFYITLGPQPIYLAATAVMSVSSGVALFGANLYFLYWLMFTPLLATAVLVRGGDRAYVAAAFIGGLAYFVVRYEFATTFALMWLLPVVLGRHERPAAMLSLGAAVFGAVCASFLVAVALHLISVMSIEHTDLRGAAALVFEKLGMRVASLDNNIPPPLTAGFVKAMLYRWSDPAFHVEDVFSVSKAVILAVFAAICAIDRSVVWRFVAAWAVATYASWYVFAYQHAMQHYPYDAMLFAPTISLVVVLRLFSWKRGEVWRLLPARGWAVRPAPASAPSLIGGEISPPRSGAAAPARRASRGGR